jgi:hypothetical protein
MLQSFCGPVYMYDLKMNKIFRPEHSQLFFLTGTGKTGKIISSAFLDRD